MRKYKTIFVIVILLINSFSVFSSVKSYGYTTAYFPNYKSFEHSFQIAKPLKLRKITIAEYITDPLILYVSLLALFGITSGVWEEKPKIIEGKNAGDTFINRLKMEPFATGRIDPIMKEWNGSAVFTNDIYVKNIIEPAYFSYMGLYLRSKNYHPAILIAEMFMLSLLYEFTIKPFFRDSSFEQLLKNPSASVLVAILFDEISTYLLSTPYLGLHILAYILNPFNALPTARIHSLLMFDPFKKSASIEAIINL